MNDRPDELSLRCECGAVSGALVGVARRRVNWGLCYCRDCQAFARHLGRGAEVLDEYGGTKIIQCTPNHVEIREGVDKIACLQLEEGGLFRWYASCCDTLIANTVGKSWIPFAGVITNCLRSQDSGELLDQAELEATVGPPTARVHHKYAIATDEEKKQIAASGDSPLALAFALLGLFGRGFVGRQHRHSPFFHDGAPIVAPRVLSNQEHAAAMQTG